MTPDEFVSFFGNAKASAILRTPNADSAAPAMEAAIRRSKGFVRKGETVYRVEIPEDSVP